MSWSLAMSLAVLRSQVDGIAPRRSRAADGTIGDAAHAATKSEHNPDRLGIVRALDLTNDPAGGLDAQRLAEALRASRDPRILYVISRGRMFSSYPTSSHPAWTWRPYAGPNGHFTHVHVSVGPSTRALIGTRWALPGLTTPPAPPTQEEEAMTPELKQELDYLQAQLKDLATRQNAQTGVLERILAAITTTGAQVVKALASR